MYIEIVGVIIVIKLAKYANQIIGIASVFLNMKS